MFIRRSWTFRYRTNRAFHLLPNRSFLWNIVEPAISCIRLWQKKKSVWCQTNTGSSWPNQWWSKDSSCHGCRPVCANLEIHFRTGSSRRNIHNYFDSPPSPPVLRCTCWWSASTGSHQENCFAWIGTQLRSDALPIKTLRHVFVHSDFRHRS